MSRHDYRNSREAALDMAPDSEPNWRDAAPFKHSRSMVEAFGPYTYHRLHPMPEQQRSHPIYGAVLAVVMGLLLAALLFHWLSK